jgi:hypothetical protein
VKSPEYRFLSTWFIPNARCEDVSDVLQSSDKLAEWWPAVYLEVTVVERGGEHGLGQVLDLFTKGWLPYTLRWKLRVESVDYPHGSTISASGDLTGRGVWAHEQTGDGVQTTYDWSVSADKPLLRYGSFALRPLFAANHRWAMATGEISMCREIARRRGAVVQPPPQPTFWRPKMAGSMKV